MAQIERLFVYVMDYFPVNIYNYLFAVLENKSLSLKVLLASFDSSGCMASRPRLISKIWGFFKSISAFGGLYRLSWPT